VELLHASAGTEATESLLKSTPPHECLIEKKSLQGCAHWRANFPCLPVAAQSSLELRWDVLVCHHGKRWRQNVEDGDYAKRLKLTGRGPIGGGYVRLVLNSRK
jgi:hypothetical protein